jgi:hypothetical protein
MSDAGVGDVRFLVLVGCAFLMGVVSALASGMLSP